MPSNKTRTYVLIFSILSLLHASEAKTGLFASPSWLSPAIRYGAYISGMCIAGKVSWHHIQKLYKNKNQKSITHFAQLNQPIPNNLTDQCANEFLKIICSAYNDQLKTDPTELGPIKKLICKHHILI